MCAWKGGGIELCVLRVGGGGVLRPSCIRLVGQEIGVQRMHEGVSRKVRQGSWRGHGLSYAPAAAT